ncbi:MAG: alpha/beta hydrolase [Spirochaetota bacterium]
MKKKPLIVLSIVMLILITAGVVLYLMMSRPAYKPGMLRTRKDLTEPPSQSSAQAGYWQVDNTTEIYHFSEGQGTPVLVIHGGPGIPHFQPWAGLKPVDGYEFYYYHQRGCGRSTRPFDRFQSQNYYKNMTALIAALGIEQQLADIERIRKILRQEKIILIGHSYGGFIATLYAIEFPLAVEKMILISPAGVLKLPADNDGMGVIKNYLPDKSKKDFDDFLKRYFDYGRLFTKSEKELAALNSEYGKFYVEASKQKGIDIPTHIKGEINQTDQIGGWVVHAIYLSLGRKYDYRNELKKITADTLVVYGEKDIYPARISEEYAELIPNSTKEMVAGAGHFVYDEQPEYFSRLVADFLKD